MALSSNIPGHLAHLLFCSPSERLGVTTPLPASMVAENQPDREWLCTCKLLVLEPNHAFTGTSENRIVKAQPSFPSRYVPPIMNNTANRSHCGM